MHLCTSERLCIHEWMLYAHFELEMSNDERVGHVILLGDTREVRNML
jgi:hypothetical protein